MSTTINEPSSSVPTHFHAHPQPRHIIPSTVQVAAAPSQPPHDLGGGYWIVLSMGSPYSGEFANISFTLPDLLPPSQWDEGPPERPPEGVSITITKRRGEGAIHETFDAALRLHPDDTPKPCILRSADVELFSGGDFSMNDARRAVMKEAAVYHHLGPLQGTVVPRYWGIGNELHYDEPLEHATALVSVMDDGGTELSEDEMGNHDIRSSDA